MKSLIFLSLIMLNSCAWFNLYQPIEVSCNLMAYDRMKVLEYTRVCERESYNTWQFCAVQAERLYCNHPVWSKNGVKNELN